MGIFLSEDIDPDYIEDVKNILNHQEFLALRRYVHHHWTNRLMHSLNVSYISWKIARKLGCDAKAAARAGLLHDFCLYNFKEQESPTGESQLRYHPKAAAENSKRVFKINQREEHAIKAHMFPLGPMPKNKEAWIITLADKICAATEFCKCSIALSKNQRVILVEEETVLSA